MESRCALKQGEIINQAWWQHMASSWKIFMSKALVAHVQSLENFISEIQDKPIKLLQAILETSRQRDPYMALLGILSEFINMKQKDGEWIFDFTKRAALQRDVLTSYLGVDFLHHFVETTKEFKEAADATAEQHVKDGALEKLMGRYLIRNADRNKYGSLVKSIGQDFSLGNNVYPKSLQ